MLLDAASLRGGLLGGVLIGSASSILFWTTGSTAGVSGLMRETLRGKASWEASFLGGLCSAGALLAAYSPGVFGKEPAVAVGVPALLALASAGALVGYGTAEGSGCTSGHGVVGLARLSPRSAVAVCTFMAAGAVAAVATQRLVLRASTGFGLPLGSGGFWFACACAAGPLIVLGALGDLRRARTHPATPPTPPARITTPSEHVAALLTGMLFGCGLGVSGMANPERVRGFLDPTSPGGWDPTLACVMGGAVCITALSFRLARSAHTTPPLCAPKNEKPLAERFAYAGAAPNLVIDAALLRGAALFGAGWGAAGYCPGPAILSAAAGSSAAQVVVASMVAGALLHELSK